MAGGALPKRGRGEKECRAVDIMDLSAKQPFAEERTAETVFSVAVVDDVFAFKFGDGFFHGCRTTQPPHHPITQPPNHRTRHYALGTRHQALKCAIISVVGKFEKKG